MNQMKRKSSGGLRVPVIILSGLIVSFFVLLLVVYSRFIDFGGKATVESVEKMIRGAEYYKALASLESSTEKIKQNDLYLQKARVWMALAWEKQNQNKWRSYGTNNRNWLDVAEADSAEKYLKAILRNDADAWEAHFQLGNLYMERGWFSEAESSFIAALRQKKTSMEVRINLAVLYSRMRKYTLAEQEFTLLSREDSDNPKIAKNLGFLYRFYLDNPQKAIVWLNRYLNNAEENDRDVNFARTELENLLQRYPEYAPSEPQSWRKKNRFSVRG